jgi:uncharacterized protein (DUF433 family)
MKASSISVQDMPAYTIADAAAYLGLPITTVRAWVKGQNYKVGNEVRPYRPLITPADKAKGLLSFRNLIELHVLSVTRRIHGISMPKMRATVNYLKKAFDTAHPLADVSLKTDGIHVFVEQLEQQVSASEEGQISIREIVDQYLERIGRDEQGNLWLYPFTRPSDHLEQPRIVVMDPRISFGRPVIANTGVRTSMLAERYRAGDSMQALVDDYGLDQAVIEEAIRCEMRKAA